MSQAKYMLSFPKKYLWDDKVTPGIIYASSTYEAFTEATKLVKEMEKDLGIKFTGWGIKKEIKYDDWELQLSIGEYDNG